MNGALASHFHTSGAKNALSPTLPIIFLSARDSDFDIVAGLRLGADDYLTKDVSLPHLLARIAALFRRSDLLATPQASEEILERGPEIERQWTNRQLHGAKVPALILCGKTGRRRITRYAAALRSRTPLKPLALP